MAVKRPAPQLRAALEHAKQESVGQLLFKAARLLNERALGVIHAQSGTKVRMAHTALFPHIAWEGTRSTELAQRLGISKQAIGQLIGDLEEMGVVRREPDPSDGRAALIRFTAHGQQALLHGLSVLKELEDELSREVGSSVLRTLKTNLTTLIAALEKTAKTPVKS